MDSDNSESGKEEEDDDEDEDEKKKSVDRAMANQKQYMQMCQTSARILQVLSGYMGAPAAAHIIELESVSEDSDEVSSCSTPPSSSQASNNEESSRPGSSECVIYAEPLLSCRLLASDPQPCIGSVRRLPPGVTPEDVKRSKEEAAAKTREMAAKHGRRASIKSDAHPKSSIPQQNSLNTASRSLASCSSSGSTSETSKDDKSNTVKASATFVGAGDGTDAKQTCVASRAPQTSLTSTQRGFHEALSELSDVSETIRQAHSLLTSMGLGRYVARRLNAQLNNNNNPNADDEVNGSSCNDNDTNKDSETENKQDEQTTSHLDDNISGECVKLDEISLPPSGEKVDAVTETDEPFPPLIVVKPTTTNTADNSNDTQKKACANLTHTKAVEASTMTDSNQRFTAWRGRGILKRPYQNYCSNIPVSASASKPTAASAHLTQAGLRGNKNDSAHASLRSEASSSWLRWSSHLQQAPRVTTFTNRHISSFVSQSRGGVGRSRTMESTSLASSSDNTTTMCPTVQASKTNEGCQASNAIEASVSEKHKDAQNGSCGKDKSHVKAQICKQRHVFTDHDVKDALNIAIRNLKQSGRWISPERETLNVDEKAVLRERVSEDASKIDNAENVDVVNEVENVDLFSQVCDALERGVSEDLSSSNPEGNITKRVTFLAEPILINTHEQPNIEDAEGSQEIEQLNTEDSEGSQEIEQLDPPINALNKKNDVISLKNESRDTDSEKDSISVESLPQFSDKCEDLSSSDKGVIHQSSVDQSSSEADSISDEAVLVDSHLSGDVAEQKDVPPFSSQLQTLDVDCDGDTLGNCNDSKAQSEAIDALGNGSTDQEAVGKGDKGRTVKDPSAPPYNTPEENKQGIGIKENLTNVLPRDDVVLHYSNVEKGSDEKCDEKNGDNEVNFLAESSSSTDELKDIRDSVTLVDNSSVFSRGNNSPSVSENCQTPREDVSPEPIANTADNVQSMAHYDINDIDKANQEDEEAPHGLSSEKQRGLVELSDVQDNSNEETNYPDSDSILNTEICPEEKYWELGEQLDCFTNKTCLATEFPNQFSNETEGRGDALRDDDGVANSLLLNTLDPKQKLHHCTAPASRPDYGDGEGKPLSDEIMERTVSPERMNIITYPIQVYHATEISEVNDIDENIADKIEGIVTCSRQESSDINYVAEENIAQRAGEKSLTVKEEDNVIVSQGLDLRPHSTGENSEYVDPLLSPTSRSSIFSGDNLQKSSSAPHVGTDSMSPQFNENSDRCLSTSDMSRKSSCANTFSPPRRLWVKRSPKRVRSISSQTGKTGLVIGKDRAKKSAKPAKYFPSQMRRPKSAMKNLEEEDAVNESMDTTAETKHHFSSVVEPMSVGDCKVKTPVPSCSKPRSPSKRDNQVLPTVESSVSVIELLPEKPAEQVELPEPDIRRGPGGKKGAWEKTADDVEEDIALVKHKVDGGSSNSFSGDESHDKDDLTQPGCTEGWRYRRRRLRVRRRTRRSRSSNRLARCGVRGIRWFKSRMKSLFSPCFK